MRKRRYYHGKCSTQWDRAYPAEKDHQQYGTAADDLNDHTGILPHYDLSQVFLVGLHESDMTGGDANNIDTQITVAGPLPPLDLIDVTYTLAFNTDNNPETGMVYLEQYWGIDRIVKLNAFGIIEEGTFMVWAYAYDPINESFWELPEPPEWAIEYQLVDLDEPAEPRATSFLCKIPKDILELDPNAAEIPVIVTSGDPYGDIFDSAALVFDPYRWMKDPTLNTFGDGVPDAHAPYAFEILGLDPNSPCKLYLDDTVVYTATTDSSGKASGAFEFPTEMPINVPHFLTAQDQTGEFAYSMTCPEQASQGQESNDN